METGRQTLVTPGIWGWMVSVNPHPPNSHKLQSSSAAPAFRVTRYLSRTKREYVKHGTKIQKYGVMSPDGHH